MIEQTITDLVHDFVKLENGIGKTDILKVHPQISDLFRDLEDKFSKAQRTNRQTFTHTLSEKSSCPDCTGSRSDESTEDLQETGCGDMDVEMTPCKECDISVDSLEPLD